MKINRTCLLLFVLGLFINTACTSLIVHLPAARFDSPETPGHLKKRLGVGGAIGAHDVRVTDNASDRPPTFEPKYQDSIEAPLVAGLGLGDAWEVGVRYAFINDTALITGKYKIMGPTSRESQPGDFSLAVAVGAGAQSTSISGDQNGLFGPGGYTWNANETTTALDFAVIAGYRFASHFMMYGGPFYTSYQMHGHLHDDASDNQQSPSADYDLAARGSTAGVNLDYEFTFNEKKLFSLTLETAYESFQWSAMPMNNGLRGGVLAAWVF